MNDVRLTEWWDVLPQLAFAVLSWNLDHSRLVDDARCPVALLNDANDPRLVPFLLLDVLAERSRLLSRQSNQKTAYTQDNQQMQLQQSKNKSSAYSHILVKHKSMFKNLQITEECPVIYPQIYKNEYKFVDTYSQIHYFSQQNDKL